MDRLWIVQRADKDYVEYLAKASGISGALAGILINRGIKTPQAVRDFFSADLGGLMDPLGLKGMAGAVRIITRTKSSGRPALVHGDYDADGIASAAIMVDSLRRFGLPADYFIPNRFDHGYGFHEEAVWRAKRMGAGLIVTTDCGITAFETARLARENGIEVVITDHHEPARGADGNPLIPEAGAVVNPKLSPGEPELSGTGVAFKLAQALLGDDAHAYLDLAALGTLADLVPVSGENRLIAKAGLELMERNARVPIKALREVAGCQGRVTWRSVCFGLIPRLNAPGRLEDASKGVNFLLSTGQEEAWKAAQELDRINKERQRLEESVYTEARAAIERDGFEGAIVVSGAGWHKGVLGIVASKMTERYRRPCIVLSVEADEARGSARSIPQFNLYEGLNELGDMLIAFGGHRQAAGLRMKAGMIGQFRSALSKLVLERVPDFRATLRIDADVTLRDLGMDLVKEMRMLEPYGFGNPEPLFGAKGLEVLNPRVVGKGHLKLKLSQKGLFPMDAIGFDMAGVMRHIEDAAAVDAAFTPVINEWERGRTLQLNLKGLRPSGGLRPAV
ncbi:MAG: single-stranded-DNA-specific exonuclease RecJ [Nitrospiraceae bacterium]|nr:single-stranded-DNA-specific exonuclease RecJ [Nitrospiraceae bacterium]